MATQHYDLSVEFIMGVNNMYIIAMGCNYKIHPNDILFIKNLFDKVLLLIIKDWMTSEV